MGQISWKKGGAYDCRPNVNFTRFTFIALVKPKEEIKGPEEMKVEKSPEELQLSTFEV